MNYPVPSTDLNRYIRTVNKYPVLSEEREKELALRYKEENDLDAAQELVLSHLRVVVRVSRDYAGYGLPQEDLIQEGTIGLMQAVKNFDPLRGVRLVSFALHYIRGSIQEYVVQNWRLVKLATTKAQRKLFFNLRSLRKDLDTLKPDEIESIAEKLEVSEIDVREMEKRFSNYEMTTEINLDDDGHAVRQDIEIIDDDEHEPYRLLEKSQTIELNRTQLAKSLEMLDDRSRRIIETRWLNEGEESTLHDLSLEFGVSKERIRQIEQKALQKMQSNFSEVVTEYIGE